MVENLYSFEVCSDHLELNSSITQVQTTKTSELGISELKVYAASTAVEGHPLTPTRKSRNPNPE